MPIGKAVETKPF